MISKLKLKTLPDTAFPFVEQSTDHILSVWLENVLTIYLDFTLWIITWLFRPPETILVASEEKHNECIFYSSQAMVLINSPSGEFQILI